MGGGEGKGVLFFKSLTSVMGFTVCLLSLLTL